MVQLGWVFWFIAANELLQYFVLTSVVSTCLMHHHSACVQECVALSLDSAEQAQCALLSTFDSLLHRKKIKVCYLKEYPTDAVMSRCVDHKFVDWEGTTTTKSKQADCLVVDPPLRLLTYVCFRTVHFQDPRFTTASEPPSALLKYVRKRDKESNKPQAKQYITQQQLQ